MKISQYIYLYNLNLLKTLTNLFGENIVIVVIEYHTKL